jgi:acyl dehydratase
MRRFASIDDLAACAGQEVAVTAWVLVDQARIDRFAEATGDRQWIHVDPRRAQQGPFGATVAHGFLTLSLVPAMMETALQVEFATTAVNYGLNKVRFIAPVPVDSRLRARVALGACERAGGSAVQVLWSVLVEREGAHKPVCAAEMLVRYAVPESR